MGTIAGQPAARGGDASALGSLLASQKDNIAKAMPPGFRNLLSGTGLLEKFGMAGTATAAAGEATRAVQLAPQASAPQARQPHQASPVGFIGCSAPSQPR